MLMSRLPNRGNSQRRFRHGMSLIELTLAMTIMTLVAGTLGALSMTVQQTNDHASGRAMAMQHARVLTQRIERAISDAHGSESFPGMLMLAEQVGSESFPTTLIVWTPAGTPVDATGLPRFNEITIFTPSPAAPNELLMVTMPADTRICPSYTNITLWQTEIAAALANAASQISVLTDVLRFRSQTITDASGVVTATDKAAVRFSVDCVPSMAEFANYRAETTSWNELKWPQNLVGKDRGVRRCWCRFEVQLTPPSPHPNGDQKAQNAIPFFGSSAIHYELTK